MRTLCNIVLILFLFFGGKAHASNFENQISTAKKSPAANYSTFADSNHTSDFTFDNDSDVDEETTHAQSDCNQPVSVSESICFSRIFLESFFASTVEKTSVYAPVKSSGAVPIYLSNRVLRI